MNNTTNDTPLVAARLADLNWLCGSWTGALGPQIVEEAWSQPAGGTMSTMVRLYSPTETIMIELIAIREDADSLVLHLRQFSPALETRLAQDMPLVEIGAGRVAFQGPSDSNIPKLTYRLMGERTMEVDVTTGDGTVLTASLTRS